MTNGPRSMPAAQGRNEPCACGSGKKYKRCCGALSDPVAVGGPAAPHGDPELFRRGVQLLQSGRPSEALPLLFGALRSDAAHFEAHLALASALMQNGRFADAGGILLRALALRPDAAVAWRDLAVSYDRQNLHEPAIEAYRRAVELAPKLGDAQHRLGELYAMYGKAEEASACFGRAADAVPNATKARLLRSDACLLRGEMAEAEDWARKALALDASSDAAHGTLGGLLYTQGRFEEAATHFERALRLNPKLSQCWDGLVRCRNFSAFPEAAKSVLERLGSVLERRDLRDTDRMAIHFSRGKVYDDCGDYGHAMQEFDAANRLRAKDLQFDRTAFAARVDRTIELFTPEFIARNAASGNPDPKPLFIVGMYRSGTTLVEQVVSSHPDIAAGGELTVWAPADMEIDAATGDFDSARAQAAILKYLSVLNRIGPSAARVTDKLPFNFFRLGAIHALLPNARIIHCRRDAVDTCLSIYANPFSSRLNFAASKENLAFVYGQYLRMMEHWRRVLPPERLLEIDYERLISARESESRRMIAFAGLDWNESCLRPEQNRRSINTASAWQARQPVYATSLRRWRHYEQWLGELRALLPKA